MSVRSILRTLGRVIPGSGIPSAATRGHAARRLSPAQRAQVEELLTMGQDCHAIAFTTGLNYSQVYRIKQSLTQG